MPLAGQMGKVKWAPARPRLTGPRRGFRLLLTVALSICVFFYLLSTVSRAGLDRAQSVYSSFGRREDVLRFVDPLIGTVNGGHVFPGATLPYGMVKAGADTNSRSENAAGWVSDDSEIIGFSHLHDSGTGGKPSLGNFPLFVHPRCPHDDYTKCNFTTDRRAVPRVAGSVRATPGYFAVGLENAVHAEMTATQHAALYRFSFGDVAPSGEKDASSPESPLSPLLLLDLTDLAGSRATGAVHVNATQGETTARIIADGSFFPSFGVGAYQAFVCVDVRGATVRRSGTFKNGLVVEDPKTLNSSSATIPPGSAGAWVQFAAPEDGGALLARTGVSFLSTERACANAEAEVPAFDFDSAFRAAREAWRGKLAAVAVDGIGADDALLTTFWSGLYRTMLSPQNYTGENPLWDGPEPYYDSFYCIWDSFRAQHPLLTIIDPLAQTEMLRALIDIYRNEGKLPDCRMSFSKGYSQGGSNADVVVADAWVKGLREGVDWADAYDAVVSDAEVEPPRWDVEGRGGLVSYHRLGYIPVDDVDRNGTGPGTREISRLVEYAYNDFCISLLALGMGRAVDAAKYRKRSANWKNIWRADQQDVVMRDSTQGNSEETVMSGFVGFPQPRRRDGRWAHQDVRLCSPAQDYHGCYFDTRHATYEGSPWLYSFFVPQDMEALITAMGGRDTFTDRLGYWHEQLSYIGNEQAFLPVFQFHYARRPDLSAYWARRYIARQFNASVNGIPGNDDCAMGAFSAFVAMGFFPVAGQDVYLLTPPLFREVRIRATARPGKEAVVRVRNWDATRDGRTHMYIESATLDGRPYARNWITHRFFREGGTLELVVADAPGTWGTGEKDVPPSYTVGVGERDDIVEPGVSAEEP